MRIFHGGVQVKYVSGEQKPCMEIRAGKKSGGVTTGREGGRDVEPAIFFFPLDTQGLK